MTDRICIVPACGNPYSARGLCKGHYYRLGRYGDPLGVARPRVSRPLKIHEACSVADCGRTQYGRSLCAHHWRKWKSQQPQQRCAVANCPTPRYKREWCQAHYRRWRLSGSPVGTDMGERRAKRANVAEVFWARVTKTETCWLWNRPPNNAGYGTIKVDSRTVMAHRFAWELASGPVPDGMELDHLCRVRACVRPSHLEPVTHAENGRRAATARRT